MAWPADDLTETNIDQGTDSPAQGRVDLKAAVDKLKAVLAAISAGATVWSSANDGAGSGLDADTVDGIQGSALLQKAGGTLTGAIVLPAMADQYTPTLRDQNGSGFGYDTGSGVTFLACNYAAGTLLRITPVLGNSADGMVLVYGGGEGVDGVGFDADGHSSFVQFTLGITGGANSAACVIKTAKNSSTSRSINTAGTVNASGADYAEYERKRDDCGDLPKGAVVGFDAAGLLTDKWSLAVTFGVKSTDPSYVGGDAWGGAAGEPPPRPRRLNELPLPPFTAELYGLAEPSPPVLEEEPVLPQTPVRTRSERLLRSALSQHIGAVRARNTKRLAAHGAAAKAYTDALAAARQQHQDLAAQRVANKATNEKTAAAHAEAMAAWQAKHDAERARVDRVAYAGKVPVNVTGAKPGDYIVAAQGDGDAIVGKTVALSAADLTRIVGRVRSIGADGRPVIVVIQS